MRGICKFFPGVRALDGVDFTLRRGEIHALMGENGAGKSTLIKVLTGVYPKDEGTISMEGTPVQIRTTQDALKAGISTVYQEITLCPNLTVAENLYIGRTRGAFTNWRKMNAGAKKILESLGIPAAPTQQLSSCSIAVQQMVAIARAVDMECKVLILDEPTAGLDPAGRESILKNIRDYQAAQQAAVVMVSHSMEEIASNVDRLIVMEKGTAVMTGAPSEVFSHAAELVSMGLNVPCMTQVLLRLQQLGVNVPASAYTVEQAADLLEPLLKGGAQIC